MNFQQLKLKAALFSIISNVFLIIIKFIAGLISNSLALISEALHSFSDLLASIMTFFSVKFSNKPADESHPYGHSKIENVTAVIEALLVILAGVYILYETFISFFTPKTIKLQLLVIIIALISFITNYFASKYIYKVAKKTDSVALEGDGLHLKADMFTSLGIAVGYVIIILTGFVYIDNIIAGIIASYMIYEGVKLTRKSFNPILDASIDENEKEQIFKIIEKYKLNIHDFKTRKSGNTYFIEFHLDVSGNISVNEAHEICDNIENEIIKIIPSAIITIHVEPLSS
ncbi:MAG: cation diffusion facilitator family transporter [Bacteroidales bacterium]|nr:cation diffusion facilitator family transporter [Bacteroidales bacterium]